MAQPGDTIWMGAADRDGVTVSFIQSIFFEFGSGVVLRDTGINWQNRGASFSLDETATNALKPGRKPFHTLNPALAHLADGRVMSYGTMVAKANRKRSQPFLAATLCLVAVCKRP